MLTIKSCAFFFLVCSLLFWDQSKFSKVFGLEDSSNNSTVNGSSGSGSPPSTLQTLNGTQLVDAEPNCNVHCSIPSCQHGFNLKKCSGCNCCYYCDCDEKQCPYYPCPINFSPGKINEWDCCPNICKRNCPDLCPIIRCQDGFIPYKGENDCCPRCVSCSLFCDDEPKCFPGWHPAKRNPSDCCKTICVRDNNHNDCDNIDCPFLRCADGYILRKDPSGPYGTCCNTCVRDCRNVFCTQVHCDSSKGFYEYTPPGECCKQCRRITIN